MKYDRFVVDQELHWHSHELKQLFKSSFYSKGWNELNFVMHSFQSCDRLRIFFLVLEWTRSPLYEISNLLLAKRVKEFLDELSRHCSSLLIITTFTHFMASTLIFPLCGPPRGCDGDDVRRSRKERRPIIALAACTHVSQLPTYLYAMSQRCKG